MKSKHGRCKSDDWIALVSRLVHGKKHGDGSHSGRIFDEPNSLGDYGFIALASAIEGFPPSDFRCDVESEDDWVRRLHVQYRQVLAATLGDN